MGVFFSFFLPPPPSSNFTLLRQGIRLDQLTESFFAFDSHHWNLVSASITKASNSLAHDFQLLGSSIVIRL